MWVEDALERRPVAISHQDLTALSMTYNQAVGCFDLRFQLASLTTSAYGAETFAGQKSKHI